MKTTSECSVDLLDSMGTDLTVVNAARVSFDKESEWEYDYLLERDNLSTRDAKLVQYLAKHNHWSPFAHTSIQLRVTAPTVVARQLVKHQVGLVWNEVSRRYVDDEPTFYVPQKWRKKAENVKQGSSEEEVEAIELDGFTTTPHTAMESFHRHSAWLYKQMLDSGVAPEQARLVLPQSMMTSWYWTGSLLAFHRVYSQRIDSHAQKETQEVAKLIGEHCSELFPISWRALNGDA